MNRFILVSLLTSLLLTAKIQAEVDVTNLPNIQITTQYSDSPDAENITKLIDNLSSTKFLTFNSSTWVQCKIQTPYVVSRYTLTSGNDAPERDPLNWKLAGSNNGVTFYTLDTRTNQDFADRGLKREFTVNNNSAAYLYYRLTMTNNSGSILQVAELELFGTEGTISTEPFADFSINSYLVTGLPVSFSNASLNTKTCNWTFEGGDPSTSTETNPKVIYNTPGNYKVSLVASNGTNSVTKTISINVKDVNDWTTFVYPEVNLSCVNTSNSGYLKYKALVNQKGFNSIEDFVKNCCLVIAKELYYTVDEANEHNLRTIDYKLNEGGYLSYMGGSSPAIEVGFDMNYLNTFSQSHSDAVSADEVYGVLCHEICHGYQRKPRNAGDYATGTEYFGFIEGTADLARLLTGGFNPKRYARTGGSWIDGYNTTAFFYQWITDTKSATFLKDINRTALTIDNWSFNAVTMELFGESAQSLWNAYQVAIPTLEVKPKTENRVTISLNQPRTELKLDNLNIKDSIIIHDLNGKLLLKTISTGTTQIIDIHKFRTGVYVISIGYLPTMKIIKFVK